MASLYRDLYDKDGLPTIGRSGLVGSTDKPFRLGSYDDIRYSSSHGKYDRPSSPTGQSRRLMLELQDQLKTFKDEVRKKDALIAQLSSSTEGIVPATFDGSKVESLIASALQSGTSKTELAALQVKVETLTNQLRDAEHQIDAREMRIRELKAEVDSHREAEARHKSLSESLQKQIAEIDLKAGTYEALKGRSELTINTIQQENSEARERILELEARLRKHLEERETAEQDKINVERKCNDILSHLNNNLLLGETSLGDMNVDTIKTKVTSLVEENAMLKGKLLTLTETLNNTELETKASRETIMRLVSEVGREQKNMATFNVDVQNLRVERDNALAEKRESTREIDSLKERLESMQRAWNATRQELEDREQRLAKFNRDNIDASFGLKNTETQYTNLKETLAALLSDKYRTIPPSDDTIKDAVKELVNRICDSGNHIGVMDEKVKRMSEQFESQYDKAQSAERRVKRLEADLADMHDRLRHYESELGANDVMKEGLRVDKERYLRFLERLSEIMKIDRINADIGFDMSGEAILTRAEQLVRLQGDATAEKSTHMYSLQRKLKAMKQQLESKDLHLDLLRKKIAGLDEKVQGRLELEKDRENESHRNRKLVKQIEKYQDLLKEARSEIVDLKAQLLECSNLKLTCMEQDKEIQNLEKHMDKLERVRQKQAKRIASLKNDVTCFETTTGEQRIATESTVGSLSSELRTTKIALDDTTKRERQLLDLRQVVARMLGLDINSLAVPDYEIIARLEKLVHAHQSSTLAGLTVAGGLEDMEDGFRAGYSDATRLVGRHRSAKRVGAHVRPRSVSPVRRDTRQY